MTTRLLAIAFALMLPTSLEASSLVIGDDRGGNVAQRLLEVVQMDAQGVSIQIEGRICYSACTLLLGAKNVCVSPTTHFGFHGPAEPDGRAMDDEAWEKWSQTMADAYGRTSPSLREWFLTEARYMKGDVMIVSGQELIRLGYAQCS